MIGRRCSGWMLTVACGVLLAGCSKEAAPPKTAADRPAPKRTDTASATPASNQTAADTTDTATTDTAAAKPKGYNPNRHTVPSAPKEIIQLSAELPDDAPAGLPKVVLSAGHAATCLVKVGDKLPDGELPDTTGKKQKISQLLGPEYTIVVLWEHKLAFAHEELSDLGPKIASRYGNRGVRIIGVCVGATPEQAKSDAREAGNSFPVLIDAKGEYFGKVATSKLPRTYLVDSSGKIVWFDLEYSRTTRRELQQALRFLMPQATTAARMPGA